MTTLDAVSIGGQGVVVNIAGEDDISLRLMEMGLVPGTEFSVLGMAPLGDPLEIALRGYRLSLRRSEAKRIEVTIL